MHGGLLLIGLFRLLVALLLYCEILSSEDFRRTSFEVVDLVASLVATLRQ